MTLNLQRIAALKTIDSQIEYLKQDDPSMYYDGDFNALLDRRYALTTLLNAECTGRTAEPSQQSTNGATPNSTLP